MNSSDAGIAPERGTRSNRRSETSAVGDAAETASLHFLEAQGLRLVARNFRSRRGEIDLVMLEKSTLVFIEVRFRRSTSYGSGAETVTRRKQQRLVATARAWLQRYRTDRIPECRFDVIEVGPGAPFVFNWIRDAFEA